MPNHFIGNVTIEVKLSENLSTTEKPAKFNNVYHVWIVEPSILQRQLKKILAGDLVSEKQRQELTKLMESINENDNNYVVYAKLKGKV